MKYLLILFTYVVQPQIQKNGVIFALYSYVIMKVNSQGTFLFLYNWHEIDMKYVNPPTPTSTIFWSMAVKQPLTCTFHINKMEILNIIVDIIM